MLDFIGIIVLVAAIIFSINALTGAMPISPSHWRRPASARRLKRDTALPMRSGFALPCLWIAGSVGTRSTASLRRRPRCGSIGSSYGDGRPSRRCRAPVRDCPDEQRHPIRIRLGDRPPVQRF
jgi:hypothetical protein